jgi:acetyl-CoA acyltransferase
MSDAAAAVIIVSAQRADELELRPLARFVGFAVAGVEPDYMGIGPVYAIPKALKKAGLRLQEVDLIELNEAFAAQSLAVMRLLELDPDKVNVNGGAIALGHPLGCTGAKLTTQLMYEMPRRASRFGMVTMCIGGGMGAAAIFENRQN